MNNAVRLSRLNHLIEILKVVPKKQFLMSEWQHPNYFTYPKISAIPKNFVNVGCKTAGCAIGWASFDKRFRKAGLKPAKLNHTIVYTHKGVSHTGEYAASLFFGITIHQAQRTFTNSYTLKSGRKVPLSEITPPMVITKIKGLIKEYS